MPCVQVLVAFPFQRSVGTWRALRLNGARGATAARHATHRAVAIVWATAVLALAENGAVPFRLCCHVAVSGVLHALPQHPILAPPSASFGQALLCKSGSYVWRIRHSCFVVCSFLKLPLPRLRLARFFFAFVSHLISFAGPASGCVPLNTPPVHCHPPVTVSPPLPRQFRHFDHNSSPSLASALL